MILSRRLRGLAAAALVPFLLSCAHLSAQTGKAVTVRMLEGRSGRLIATSDFLVQINHQQEQHANWVTLNEDGTGKLTLPAEATEISVHGKYDSSMSIYVNCDSEKGKGILENQGLLQTAVAPDRWYSIADILTSGVVTANGCLKKKDAEKQKIVAKPGEFVFFVRKKNWREEDQD
ncbi:MAG TPA: hypothetical protein VLZ50_13900 [Terracidiphilus sp.]|nr:hypothetical protein [Terracidiphilus sp.]